MVKYVLIDQWNEESGRRWREHRNGSPSKTA